MNVLEKILEEIEEASIKVSTVKEHTYFKAVGTRKIKEIIRSHMSEIENDNWILCSERLPEEPKFMEEDSYIVQTGNIITPFSAYWDGKEWTDVYGDTIEVIAWQPLPKQYKTKVKIKES